MKNSDFLDKSTRKYFTPIETLKGLMSRHNVIPYTFVGWKRSSTWRISVERILWKNYRCRFPTLPPPWNTDASHTVQLRYEIQFPPWWRRRGQNTTKVTRKIRSGHHCCYLIPSSSLIPFYIRLGNVTTWEDGGKKAQYTGTHLGTRRQCDIADTAKRVYERIPGSHCTSGETRP